MRSPTECHQPVPAAPPRVWLPVVGTSMLPLLHPGDCVEVDLRPAALCVGDIVVFRVAGESVVHRVVRVRRHASDANLELVTQGDWACRPDPPIGPHQVVGKVVAVRTSGRVIALGAGVAPALSRAIARLSRLQAAPCSGGRIPGGPAAVLVRRAVRAALLPAAGLLALLALATRHLAARRPCSSPSAPSGALARMDACRVRALGEEARR